jgi:hypothetical protein
MAEVEFPNGVLIVVAQPELDDGDPDNPTFISPYFTQVEGGWEVRNIWSDQGPVVYADEGEYESDELEPALAFWTEDDKRVLCFHPTKETQAYIDDWKGEARA